MPSKHIVVVGASAAGLRCAARLRRRQPGWNITVVDARQEISVAACGLPYVLSGDIQRAEALRETADGTLRDAAYFSDVKGVTVRCGLRATRLDVQARTLHVEGAGGAEALPYDELVLATGSSAKRLAGLKPHARVHVFHTLDDLRPLTQGLQKGQLSSVAIVGAGLVGVELSEAFGALWGAEVHLFEHAAQPLPQILDDEVGALVRAVLVANDVQVHTGAAVQAIEPGDTSVRLQAGSVEVEVDAVVLALGVLPLVELAREAGADIGPTGALVVDQRLHTTLDGVWAAGDCIEVHHAVTGAPCHLPLGSLANRQGRVLADILAGDDESFGPVVGSVACKVFDRNLACAGITLAQARALGLQARAVWTSAPDRADYWPESKEIHLQLSYEVGTERLLGVQIFGEGEVAKRVDVATTYLTRKATLRELEALEHAYAPPYAPALDPLAVAAMVARDQERGCVACSPLASVEGAVLDVRREDEQQARGSGFESLAIPLASLRSRHAELRDRTWTVLCERGTRSAEAVRQLADDGIQARYVGGGLHWLLASGRVSANPGD
ncbi:MAG: FAD-dependent oxidoreductase [Pseudomonadota bacterium]